MSLCTSDFLMNSLRLAVATFIGVFAVSGVHAADSSKTESIPPKSPQESMAAIKVRDGLEVQLVASEPLIVDPVAFDWGADGKLWVVEMCDYPMGMDGNWKPGSRIKILEDTDGDGKYDKATVFLDELPFATGVTAWRKGALVCSAPNITYAEDTNGDRKADVVRKMFRGFETGNYQARVNSLSLGLDNWIYGANGLLGGIIRGEATAVSDTISQPVKVDIRGRDFRIQPDLGTFEPESGLTQQGRSRDDWGNWFGCDNSTPIWHYPIADHYLRRNPYVTTPAPRVASASGASGTQLFPISQALERFNNPGSLNHVTSGCGIGIYRDTLLGDDLYNNAFVCEPVHNLVHRMVLKTNSVTFTAVRAKEESESEFFSSKDNWTRPVQMRTAPDGSIWIADMYRFVIEHPRWIPPERLSKLDPRAGSDMGRIYRVVAKGSKVRPVVDLTKLPSSKLASMLDTPNGTERDRIHQELVFPADPKSKLRVIDSKTVKTLESLAQKSKTPSVRLQALCVLDGLNKLTSTAVLRSLNDKHPHVRANAIRLSERFANSKDSSQLADALLSLTNDPELVVRYQLALTLGEWNDKRVGPALGKLLVRDINDQWMRAAVLSSATRAPGEILRAVFETPASAPHRSGLISELIATAVGEGSGQSLEQLITTVTPSDADHLEPWQLGALSSLIDGLARKDLTLAQAANNKPELITRLNLVFDSAEKLSADAKANESSRELAVRLLGRRADKEDAELKLLGDLLDPSVSLHLQKASIAALKRNPSAKVAPLVLSRWSTLSPSLRQLSIELLLSRDEWTKQLLTAMKSGSVKPNQLPLANRQILLKSSNKEIQQQAQTIWDTDSSDRAAVVKKYRVALTLAGDPLKGRAIWAKNCVVCHYFRGEGAGVGPNLGALTDKTPEDFLVAILDPNDAVEPRFTAYNIETKDGRSLTGIIKSETATTLTVAQAGGTMETILRGDATEIRASGLSLMPEGLEQNMSPQDLANLIAYLNSAPHPFGTTTTEQAEASKKKFLAVGQNGIAKVVKSGDEQPHQSWMGELPLSACRQSDGKAFLTWESQSAPADIQATNTYDFRLPVSMGMTSTSGSFALKVNGQDALNFGVALHAQAWRSADGKIEMSYLPMEDSAKESNGILTFSINSALLQSNKPVTFEVIGATPTIKSWFGIYQVH
jgi:putative membrane-bound dehydrogenase-like protein